MVVKIISTIFAFVFISLQSLNAVASAYIGTQDKQLHYDVQTLVDWGYLNATTNTFPIPWKGVATEMKDLDPRGMAFRPRQAYLRLNHYLSMNKQLKSRRFINLQAASEDVRFRSFDDGVEDTGKASITNEFYSGRWSGQATVNFSSGGEKSLDNSFIAYQFDNWNLRLGSVDQWWGPGQSSSLIMSNNTRPIKAIALSRSSNTASKSPWLSWLGPWYLTAQLGQLNEDRAIPDAKIIMNRFSARPFKGFEFGVSWTAMWGGEGQPSGLKTLFEVLTFDAICEAEDGDCSESGKSKRGNHLAGFDLMYTHMLFDRPVSVYVQKVGEDAINYYKITDAATLFGVSTYYKGAKIFFETSDTNVACAGGDSTVTNCYYEHGDYQSGYRMYGRTFGSTFDTDAKQYTLGANIRFESGEVAEVYVRSAKLNEDGQRPSPVLTTDVSEELIEISGFYQKPVGDWLLKAGGSVATRSFENVDDEVDALIYVKAQIAF
ncbi:capsule assembly Wzi family protein [Glaciecola sp. 2405UD65-10]|uniref:capsule assembly Wzi family protein n=1 Tax=Glaciecola sp. 2405UD65-10 TaxID=3397244 RepID=UPI003B5A9ED6